MLRNLNGRPTDQNRTAPLFRKLFIAGMFQTAVMASFLTAGCGEGSSSPKAAPDSGHLQFVADSYGLFLKNNRRLPKNDAEFSEFIALLAADDPSAKGQTADQLLTSPRDGKTYIVVTDENVPAEGSVHAVYEQAGVDGRRLIADTAGNIREMDEATFQTMIPKSP